MDEIQYDWYQNDDVLVACVNKGVLGMFRLILNARRPKWKYYPVNSRGWDHLHQQIFWTFKFDHLQDGPPQGLPPLPPLPPLPKKTSIAWERVFPKHRYYFALLFPRTALWIGKSGGTARIWYVLEEDLYESYFGDGIFREFNGAVFTAKKAAKEYAASQSVPYSYGCIVKSMLLQRKLGMIKVINHETDVFAHYSTFMILWKLERSNQFR